MKLSHVAMVNWHIFDIEDIEVADDIGILGENRSGKSTLLDLLQIILTGASSTFYRLNSIAGDNGGIKGKSKRTVHGYCLGALGEDKFKRDSSLTYVAMSFADPAGKLQPVTIGLALEANRNDSAEVPLGRFVVVGDVLRTEDFVESREGNIYPIAWDDFRNAMSQRFGDRFVNHRDRALDFVREYMRRLVPGVPSSEKHAAAMLKAIVNAMTLPTGLSATEFVRNFIVPDHPIRVADLRNSIETYRSVDQAIANMKRRLAALKVIEEHIARFMSATDSEALEAWTQKRARYLASLSRHRQLKRTISAVEQRLKLRDEDVEDMKRRVREIDLVIANTMALIAARRAGSGIDVKEQLATNLERRTRDVEIAINKRLATAGRLGALPSMAGLSPSLRAAADDLAQAATGVRSSGGRERLETAEARLLREINDLSDAVEELRQRANEKLAHTRLHLEELQALVGDGAVGRSADSHLEAPTRNLMLALRQANMAPRPLCDLIEVNDPAWVAAVEGLLGRDREAILVDRADVGRATAIFKANRRDFRRASLVSLNKIRDTGEMPRAGYLPSIIRSADRDAILFVIRRYGNVRLAQTMAQFEEDGRALMQDGLYDDGLTRNHRGADPNDFKIGRSAQASLAQRRQAEFIDLKVSFSAEAAACRSLDAAAAALTELRADRSDFAALFTNAAEAYAELEAVQADIRAIQSREDDGLSDKLRANRASKERAIEEQRKLEEELADDRVLLKVSLHSIEGLQSVPGSSMHLALAKRFYAAHRSARNLARGRGRQDYRDRYSAALGGDIDEEAPHRAHTDVEHRASDALERARSALADSNDQARRALREYFTDFGPSAQVGAESNLINEIKPWMDLNIGDIEGNALREREREAAEAADRARSLFRSEFINELTSRISNLEWEIKALNAAMAGHPFHNERYSFHKTQDAIYGPILRIVDIAKASDDALDMLFRADIPEDFEYAETIAQVSSLLEDPEIDFSRFEDYRRFYTFDLHMEDVNTNRRERWEARRLTGSGAEQQVPLYVAIAASLASVYGHKPSGKAQGMSLAMFDEAFTKLDGKNQRQMISFFKSLGLQVVIVAPPEKRSIVTGYIDTIVEVDRIDDDASTEVVFIGERVRREVDAINPDNMTDERVRELSAAE